MSEINSDNVLSYTSSHIKFLLIITGFWPSEDSQKSRIDKIKGFFFIIGALIAAVTECFFVIYNSTDVITLIQHSAEGLTFLLTCLRIFFLIKNRNRFMELARKTEEILSIKKTRDEDLIVKLWHKRQIKTVKIMIRLFAFLLVVLFILGPLLFNSFPLGSKLPSICYQSPWNYIIYFIEAATITTMITGVSVIDFYIIFLIGNLCAELECIATKIMKINKNGDSIREIVDRHVNAINHGDEICRLISLFICLQYTTTAISFCISTFTIFLALDVLITVKSISTTFVLFSQIFIICYIGEMVSSYSLGISNAINNSNWHELSIENCKNLQLILLRSQKPLKLDFFIIPPMNLKAFSVFMSSTYSYITIMNRLVRR